MADLEHRVFVGEVRADGAKRTLVGYAAVFDVPASIGGFVERVAKGAFRASLGAGEDVAALVDHDQSKLLGRTRSGTLKLAEDDRGLAFEIAVPDTQLGRDVLVLAERRDLAGCSFGFRLVADHWSDRLTRELRAVELVEVSIVTGGQPAYPQTEVMARERSRARQFALSPARRRRYLAAL